MERFKRLLYRLLFPGLAIVLLSVPVAAGLLVYTFAFGHEDSLGAYISYVFSAYALTIVCAWAVKNGKTAKSGLSAWIHSVPVLHRYLTDVPFRTHVSLTLSLGLNLVYAGLKLCYGIYYRSVWFGTLAVYYFLLAVMRFLLLRHANRSAFGTDLISELKRYRLCGIILLLMNAALTGVVILMVVQQEGFRYPGYLIYVMAMYAFYNIIAAVRNVVKYRKYNSPVMSAAKTISLAAALVSMLSLETAMLAQFDNGQNPAAFRLVMTGTTGGCVCLLVLGMAIWMIVRSTGRLNTLKTSHSGTEDNK